MTFVSDRRFSMAKSQYYMNTISSRIKERRKSLDITQDELASLAGIHKNTLCKIEQGKENPRLDVLYKICDILGFEISLKVKSPNTEDSNA